MPQGIKINLQQTGQFSVEGVKTELQALLSELKGMTDKNPLTLKINTGEIDKITQSITHLSSALGTLGGGSATEALSRTTREATNMSQATQLADKNIEKLEISMSKLSNFTGFDGYENISKHMATISKSVDQYENLVINVDNKTRQITGATVTYLDTTGKKIKEVMAVTHQSIQSGLETIKLPPTMEISKTNMSESFGKVTKEIQGMYNQLELAQLKLKDLKFINVDGDINRIEKLKGELQQLITVSKAGGSIDRTTIDKAGNKVDTSGKTVDNKVSADNVQLEKQQKLLSDIFGKQEQIHKLNIEGLNAGEVRKTQIDSDIAKLGREAEAMKSVYAQNNSTTDTREMDRDLKRRQIAYEVVQVAKEQRLLDSENASAQIALYNSLKSTTETLYSKKIALLTAEKETTAELQKQHDQAQAKINILNTAKVDLTAENATRLASVEKKKSDELSLAMSAKRAVENERERKQIEEKVEAQRKLNLAVEAYGLKMTNFKISNEGFLPFGAVESFQARLHEMKTSGITDLATLTRESQNLKLAWDKLGSDTIVNKANIVDAKKLADIQITLTNISKEYTNQIDKFKIKHAGAFDSHAVTEFMNSVKKLESAETNDIKTLDGVAKKVAELKVAYHGLEAEAVKVGLQNRQSDGMGFLNVLAQKTQQMGMMMGVATGYQLMFQGIKNGVGDVIELDSALTELRITLNATEEEYQQMGRTAQTLAIGMDAEVTTVLQIIRVYANLTESLDTVKDKIAGTIALANLSGMSGEEVTDVMQGIRSQFQLTGDDVVAQTNRISDSMVAVSSNLAMDFGKGIREISEGIKVSGSSAREAGYSLEQYEALIGSVAEKTRLSGSVIGNAFKTIFARITRVNEGEGLATAEEISKTEGAYGKLGIKLREQNGEFRKTPEILSELSKKWGDLTSVQRSYIAEVSAGVRQKNIFLNAMEAYGRSEQLATEATNANGLAMKKQAIYAESAEAKISKFKATLSTMWTNAIDSSFVKLVIDAGTGIVKILSAITSKLGGFGSLVALTISVLGGFLVKSIGANIIALGSFNISLLKTTITGGSATGMLGGFAKMLGLVSVEAPIVSAGLVEVGIGAGVAEAGAVGATVAMTGFATAMNIAMFGIPIVLALIAGGFASANSAKEDGINTSTESVKANADEINSIQTLIDKKTQLEKEEREGADVKKELVEVEKKLAELLPSSVTGYTAQNEAISENTKVITANLNAKKKEAEATALAVKASLDDNIMEISKNLDKATKERDDFLALMKEGQKPLKTVNDGDGQTEVQMSSKETAEVLKKLNEQVKTNQDQINKYNASIKVLNENGEITYELVGSQAKALEKESQELGKKLALLHSLKTANEALQAGGLVKQGGFGDEADIQTQEQLSDAYGIQVEKGQAVDKMLDELNKKHVLGKESINSLIKSYPELLSYLGNEGDMRKALVGEIHDVESAEKKAIYNMLSIDEKFYEQKIKGNKSVIDTIKNGYQVDLSNAKSLAQAKLMVEQALITNLKGKWSDYYRLTSKGMEVDNGAILLSHSTPTSNIVDKLKGVNKMAVDYNAKFKQIESSFDNVALNLSGIDLGSINNSWNSADDGAKTVTEQTVYQTKLDGVDKFTSKIEDITALFKKQGDVISKVSNNIKTYMDLGDKSSLQKAITEENKLYTEQYRQILTLKTGLHDLEVGKSSVNSAFNANWSVMKTKNLSNLKKSDFTAIFEKLYPTMTTTNKATADKYEQGKKLFNQLTDDYFKFSDQISNTTNDIATMYNTLITTAKDAYDVFFKSNDLTFDGLKQKSKEIQDNIDSLPDNTQHDKREEYQQQLIASAKAYKNEVQAVINQLVAQQKKLVSGGVEWTIINDKLKDYRNTLADSNKELAQTVNGLQDIKDAEASLADSLQDKVAETLKKKYAIDKKAEIDKIDESYKKKIEGGETELEALRTQLKNLQDDTKEKQDTLNELKRQQNLWKNDNSALGRSKVVELGKEIAKQQKTVDIDALNKKIDNKQDEIDVNKKASEDEKTIVENKYSEMLKEENVYAEATKILTGQTSEQVLAILLSYDDKYKGMGTTLGKAFADGLLKEVQEGLDAMEALGNGTAPEVATPANPTPTTMPVLTPATSGAVQTPNTSLSNSTFKGTTYNQSSKDATNIANIQTKLGMTRTGVYSNATASAVSAYQKKNGIYADGQVNKATWDKMFGLVSYNTVGASTSITSGASGSTATKPATATAVAPKGAYTGTYATWINASAKANGLDPFLLAGLIQAESSFNPSAVNDVSGATGLGQFLRSTAIDEGLITSSGKDNRKDPQLSIMALGKYLKKRLGWAGGDMNKAIKGYGEGTDVYLARVLNATSLMRSQSGVSSTSSSAISWDGTVYKSGSSGHGVSRIQQNLGIYADGVFGSGTSSAVKSFQSKNGLSADGIVGQETWRKLIKFDTGGYTGDWGSDGKLGVLHAKERVLTQDQTKAFERLIYDILPNFANNSIGNISKMLPSQMFNAPVVQNDIKIVNNTPFDVNNNMDNLNKAIKQELKLSGYRLNMI